MCGTQWQDDDDAVPTDSKDRVVGVTFPSRMILDLLHTTKPASDHTGNMHRTAEVSKKARGSTELTAFLLYSGNGNED